jgi:hypothetical protein
MADDLFAGIALNRFETVRFCEGADGRFRLMWQINIPTALFAGQWFDYGLTVLRLADDEQQRYTFIAPRQLIKLRFYESAIDAMHAAIDALPK